MVSCTDTFVAQRNCSVSKIQQRCTSEMTEFPQQKDLCKIVQKKQLFKLLNYQGTFYNKTLLLFKYRSHCTAKKLVTV